MIGECKNNYRCVVDKKNRTSCKACRLRKCLMVGMSKSGSRYGRRSNWFKIHCLMQRNSRKMASVSPSDPPSITSSQSSLSPSPTTSSRSPSPGSPGCPPSPAVSPPPYGDSSPPVLLPDLRLLQLASLYRLNSLLAGYDLLQQRRAMFDKLPSHIGSQTWPSQPPQADLPIDLRQK